MNDPNSSNNSEDKDFSAQNVSDNVTILKLREMIMLQLFQLVKNG
jgi:hypothetical protein